MKPIPVKFKELNGDEWLSGLLLYWMPMFDADDYQFAVVAELDTGALSARNLLEILVDTEWLRLAAYE